ncbi:hypothetical protein GCM10023091_31390 [Ravibacter arvi]|uniref:Methionyl-tRNA formyltransferase n=1 Tax=Ravibacter arvi TaxID=2051041 RepID=A0ABP8M4E4_9BACT
MLKIGLICNTAAAFPLLQWAAANQLLGGVAILNQASEFYEQAVSLTTRMGVPLRILDRQNITDQLVGWQKSSSINIVLVLGFPLRIRRRALDSAPFGVYNIHFGKLPEYAGSFPVFWQILNGAQRATLTIHRMDAGLDTGPVAVEIPFEIGDSQSFGLVDAQYGFVAVQATIQLLTSIANNTLKLVPQTAPTSPAQGKPLVKDLVIRWEEMNAKQVTALVLATNPWNRGALALVNGFDVKIMEAGPGEDTELAPGTIFRTAAGEMAVACRDKTSVILRILYCTFGYFETTRIWSFGLSEGDRFERIPL